MDHEELHLCHFCLSQIVRLKEGSTRLAAEEAQTWMMRTKSDSVRDAIRAGSVVNIRNAKSPHGRAWLAGRPALDAG